MLVFYNKINKLAKFVFYVNYKIKIIYFDFQH